MTWAIALAVLAFVDCVLAGFRAAAGRVGQLEKRSYYFRAVKRAAAWALVLLACNAALAATLTFASADPERTWTTLASAARPLVFLYGTYAALIFAAFGFYFSPLGDFRVLTNVLIFGPFTLVRPWVIAGGLAYAALRTLDAHVIAMSLAAATSMLLFEPLLSRRHRADWRTLIAARPRD